MRTSLVVAVVVLALAGCGDAQVQVGEGGGEQGVAEQKFSSTEATLLDFSFEAELLVPGAVSAAGARRFIDAQMLYTIGHLNGDRSVGRLDRVQYSNVRAAAVASGTRITYSVKLPVSWGSKANLPSSYAFTLPRAVDGGGLSVFTERYKAACVDLGAHDVDAGSMWYYYRPRATGCRLADADVVKLTAQVVRSTENTTGKYPEYHKVWEDNALRVVAIFGKYEDGATTASDAGIAAYNAFVRALRAELRAFALVTTPANLPDAPGVAMGDVALEATLADGRKVIVNALLVDNVRTAGAAFDARYAALSTRADLIVYNGHAGLGENVRSLSRKGRFVAGQYAIVFMNGCDTFAYVDGSLAQDRARLNPEDPTGSKFMEIITNAMPSFFNQMPTATLALLRGLLKTDAPLTYEQMFKSVDRAQVVVVTGEEDNVYFPGYVPNGQQRVEKGFVDQRQELRYETAALAPGRYTVTLAPDAARPGGDADLSVRVGSAPTASAFDCRPALSSGPEVCTVTLTQRAKLFASVVGRAAGQSAFVLTLPAGAEGPPPAWAGLDERGTLARTQEARFTTPLLPVGRYTFTLSGTGDADLYVRSAVAPTSALWDCRPYASGSAEVCAVTLTAPATVHLMVQGYAASSTFRLVGKRE